jgi:hypothetical protein
MAAGKITLVSDSGKKLRFTGRTNRGARRQLKRNRMIIYKAPIPNKFATKLRYSESVNIDPSLGGVPGVHVFNASSCYDPNTTGIGHQPRGFDQWMAMFDHFTVVGSRYLYNMLFKVKLMIGH